MRRSERRERRKEKKEENKLLPLGDKRVCVKWSSCSPAAVNNATFLLALFCQYHGGPPHKAPLPPSSPWHSAHMSNDMTSECSAWTASSPKRRAPAELLKLMFTYGAHSSLFHDKRLLRCKTARMKEVGRGGGSRAGQYMLMDFKTKSAGIHEDRGARASWNLVLLLFTRIRFLLMFCSHGQLKQKRRMHRKAWCMSGAGRMLHRVAITARLCRPSAQHSRHPVELHLVTL